MVRTEEIKINYDDLLNLVDKFEYSNTLLDNKIISNIDLLEKLNNEKPNIDHLIKELSYTNDFLGKISTNLSLETKRKIEAYLNDKVVDILKEAFANNKTLQSNISKIADNSKYFKQILEQDEKHLKSYKKMLGYKGLMLSSIVSIFIGFFASTFFYKYHEISNKIENFSDLFKAIDEKRIISTFEEDFKTVLVFDNKRIVKEGDFIDDIKVLKITNNSVTFYSFRDGNTSTSNFN